MGVSEKLAKFIMETTYDDFPKDVIENAKIAIGDNLACMMASINEPSVKMLMDLVREGGGNPNSTIIGADFRASPRDAALINGTAAQALDYDDTDMVAIIHGSGSVIWATILALGEANKVTGKKILEGYVIGREVSCAISTMIDGYALAIKGWHPGSALGIFGGIAGGCKILDLDTEKIEMALGGGVSLASGSAVNFGSMYKPFHIGKAAGDATIAVELAKRGFAANKEAIEATLGFFDLYRGVTEPDAGRFVLGKPYKLSFDSKGGLNVKLYPCCHGIHTAIDNTFALKEEGKISPDDIDNIEVYTHSGEIRAHLTKDYVDGGKLVYGYSGPRRQVVPSNPVSGAEGKFSLEYCVARSLLDKEIKFAQFTEEKVCEPRVRELMKKIKVFQDERIEKEFFEGQREKDGRMIGGLMIKLKDGRSFYHEEPFSKGQFLNWVPKEAFDDKIRDCATYGGFSQEAAEDIIRKMEKVEELDNINELVQGLGG